MRWCDHEKQTKKEPHKLPLVRLGIYPYGYKLYIHYNRFVRKMQGGAAVSEVIRVEKNRNYTVMSNYHLADRRLSLKAIGLLSKILSLPDEWDYTIAGLTTICCEGKAAIATAIQELESAGYIVRVYRPRGADRKGCTVNRFSVDG